MDQVNEEIIQEDQEIIQFSKDYWVIELDNRTLSHIVSIDNLDNNDTMFFDVVQSYEGTNTFMRFPKSSFVGIYKLLDC